MKILITGVTGFAGSSLAANFLFRGHSVIALSRNDPDGRRTRGAVEKAMKGFAFEPSLVDLGRLVILDADYSCLHQLKRKKEIREVDEVWHCAAEMSFSPKKLVESFGTNQTATGVLHNIIAECSRQCRRFYYVSTAYTANFDDPVAKEELHLSPRHLNVYQASKWASEINLFMQSKTNGLPTTLFRPTLIIGHEKTGWAAQSDFGVHMVADLFSLARSRGITSLTFNVNQASEINVIPINYLTECAMCLSERKKQKEPFEIFNIAAKNGMNTLRGLEIIAAIFDMSVAICKPENGMARLIDKAIQAHKPFLEKTWIFHTNNLKGQMGARYRSFAIDEKVFRNSIVTHIKRKEKKDKHTRGAHSKSIRKKAVHAFQQAARMFGVSIKFVEPLFSMKELLSQGLKKGKRR